MRSLTIIGAIILVMIFAKLFLFKSDEKSKDKPSTNAAGQKDAGKPKSGPMSVNVYVAKKEISENQVYASGTLVPNEEVELKSEISGRINRLLIKEGSLVSKGQLIAKINDAEILARLKKNKYEEELAKQIEARQKKLLEINAISKEEYEIALNKTNTLSADKESLEVLLAQTEIRAPFSGRIGLKNISVGAYITPGTIIANMVQTNPIKIDFAMPEKYASKIKVGNKVNIKVDGQSKEISAVINAIDPKIDETLRTVKIRASCPNPGSLMPGMFVKVDVPLGNNSSIMVPTEALIPFVGGKKIFIKKNGKALETTVNIGLRTDTKVEITDGINEGDTVIVSGIMNIKNDQLVKVKNN